MIVMAGPCVIENYGSLLEIAHIVKDAGADVLRGGAFKPRTSPHSFQGLKKKGLQYIRKIGDEVGLKVVTEVMCLSELDEVERYTDIIQVGSRNMMNYSLLKGLGRTNKTILLKRGFMARIDELLQSAAYIKHHGNENIMLCERGIRTFETATRFTFDINAIPLLKQKTKMKVIADPSHGTGVRSLVVPVAKASIAAGADGIMVEVHNHPEEALSDGQQSLYPEQFAELMNDIKEENKVEKYLSK